MPVDYEKIRRISMDPKMVREIQRSPSMSAEQGPEFLEGWGGPEQYQILASLPTEERLTYAAVVLEGYTEPSEIEIVTGLTSGEVSRAITDLRRKGLVGTEVI